MKNENKKSKKLQSRNSKELMRCCILGSRKLRLNMREHKTGSMYLAFYIFYIFLFVNSVIVYSVDSRFFVSIYYGFFFLVDELSTFSCDAYTYIFIIHFKFQYY